VAQPTNHNVSVSDPAAGRGATRDHVDRSVRQALLTGRFVPGRAVTLRGLAGDLGVSPMPVREVIQRLAAEHALEVRPNGRVQVPQMTAKKFDELLSARLLLEPELAQRAFPFLAEEDAETLEEIDLEIDKSLENGDIESYMRLNHAFHFHIYEAGASDVLLPLVRSVWLQFAPFMRTVYGRVGTLNMVDWHKAAISALRKDDPGGLKEAIASDIKDGMGLIAQSFPE